MESSLCPHLQELYRKKSNEIVETFRPQILCQVPFSEVEPKLHEVVDAHVLEEIRYARNDEEKMEILLSSIKNQYLGISKLVTLLLSISNITWLQDGLYNAHERHLMTPLQTGKRLKACDCHGLVGWRAWLIFYLDSWLLTLGEYLNFFNLSLHPAEHALSFLRNLLVSTINPENRPPTLSITNDSSRTDDDDDDSTLNFPGVEIEELSSSQVEDDAEKIWAEIDSNFAEINETLNGLSDDTNHDAKNVEFWEMEEDNSVEFSNNMINHELEMHEQHTKDNLEESRDSHVKHVPEMHVSGNKLKTDLAETDSQKETDKKPSSSQVQVHAMPNFSKGNSIFAEKESDSLPMLNLPKSNENDIQTNCDKKADANICNENGKSSMNFSEDARNNNSPIKQKAELEVDPLSPKKDGAYTSGAISSGENVDNETCEDKKLGSENPAMKRGRATENKRYISTAKIDWLATPKRYSTPSPPSPSRRSVTSPTSPSRVVKKTAPLQTISSSATETPKASITKKSLRSKRKVLPEDIQDVKNLDQESIREESSTTKSNKPQRDSVGRLGKSISNYFRSARQAMKNIPKDLGSSLNRAKGTRKRNSTSSSVKSDSCIQIDRPAEPSGSSSAMKAPSSPVKPVQVKKSISMPSGSKTHENLKTLYSHTEKSEKSTAHSSFNSDVKGRVEPQDYDKILAQQHIFRKETPTRGSFKSSVA